MTKKKKNKHIPNELVSIENSLLLEEFSENSLLLVPAMLECDVFGIGWLI